MARSDPPLDGDERTMLVGWLDFHRETLAIKCDGLDAEQLARRPISTSMHGTTATPTSCAR